jgi:hypothetical protein
MQKKFMPEIEDTTERLRILRDNHKSEKGKYFVRLSQAEMDQRRETLADNSIKLFKKGEELKQVKAEFKEVMEPWIRENNQLMEEIDTKQAERDGEQFFVPNYDPTEDFPMGSMEIYDENGDLISVRRLQPGERQERAAFFIPKKAANDE